MRKDIDNLLTFKPFVPLYIVMHATASTPNAVLDEGSELEGCSYVHAVELDLVAGSVNPSPTFQGQLWGGLALGILRPAPRRGHFEITGRSELTFQIAHQAELAVIGGRYTERFCIGFPLLTAASIRIHSEQENRASSVNGFETGA